MFWSTINFSKLTKLLLPTFLRRSKTVAFFSAVTKPFQSLANDILYKMQHDGRKIYLEKMLNEHFNIEGYDPQNHEDTKVIYIDDIPEAPKLYIYQDIETPVSYLEDDDDDNDDDIFLDGDTENLISYSWIVFVPNTLSFQENQLRALIDSYRYIGKKYKIEIFAL